MTFGEAGPVPAQGAIAQRCSGTPPSHAASVEPGTPVMNEDGTPKVAHGPLAAWRVLVEGTKIGYEDAVWTLMKSTPWTVPERHGFMRIRRVEDR